MDTTAEHGKINPEFFSSTGTDQTRLRILLVEVSRPKNPSIQSDTAHGLAALIHEGERAYDAKVRLAEHPKILQDVIDVYFPPHSHVDHVEIGGETREVHGLTNYDFLERGLEMFVTGCFVKGQTQLVVNRFEEIKYHDPEELFNPDYARVTDAPQLNCTKEPTL